MVHAINRLLSPEIAELLPELRQSGCERREE